MENKLKQDVPIGQNLKKYRIAAGFSQEAVAAALQLRGLDLPQKIISEIELGSYSIRISVLLALAELYHTPIQDFFADLERYEQAGGRQPLPRESV